MSRYGRYGGGERLGPRGGRYWSRPERSEAVGSARQLETVIPRA